MYVAKIFKLLALLDASSLCHMYCLKPIEHGPKMMRLYIKASVDVAEVEGKCTALLVENLPFLHVGRAVFNTLEGRINFEFGCTKWQKLFTLSCNK